MVGMLNDLLGTFIYTLRDVAPIILLIGLFQLLVIKKSIPNLKRVVFGMILVIIGLTFFLLGLERALFPIGEMMAKQLSNPAFIEATYSGEITDWQAYY
jgi:Na+/phosphate symporter